MFRIPGIGFIKALYLIFLKAYIYLLILFLCASFNALAQFAPPVGQTGTTAIFKDSSVFIAWANKGYILRGLQDISNTTGLYTTVGDSSSAFGKAGTTGIVSLGDGGMAVLEFENPIKDELGPDFAVFENSFDDAFLELAFVEVSSDGVHFYRFPAISHTDTITQTWSFGYTDATKINNLAGKYRGEYGTPFDLNDISNATFLDKQSISFVKIIDVVGCMLNAFCTRDFNGNKINDPWPTDFSSGGFDLDAVGVIHQQSVGLAELVLDHSFVFPNPSTDLLYVNCNSLQYSLEIKSMIGNVILKLDNLAGNSSISMNEIKTGVYFLTLESKGDRRTIKIVKQ